MMSRKISHEGFGRISRYHQRLCCQGLHKPAGAEEWRVRGRVEPPEEDPESEEIVDRADGTGFRSPLISCRTASGSRFSTAQHHSYDHARVGRGLQTPSNGTPSALYRRARQSVGGSTCPSLLAARLALTTTLAGARDGTCEIWSTLRATAAARLALTTALSLRPRDEYKC